MAFEIAQATARDADDSVLVSQLVEIINVAYKTSEGDIWIDSHLRTTPDDLARLIRAGEIFVARRASQVVGTVRICEDERSLEWGQLASVPAVAGQGLGRAIAAYVEARARAKGRSVVTLEVLVPKTAAHEPRHPAKGRLQDWYARMGYEIVRKGDLAEMYPAFVPDLARDCDYVFYEKRLQPAAPFVITQLTPKDAEDAALVNRLVTMVCTAFEASEGHGSAHGNIWVVGHARTTAQNTVEQIRRGEIFVVRAGSDPRVIGTVRIVETDERSMYWGQLASSQVSGSKGLGRAIASFVEARARATGRSVVELQVLVPSTYVHPYQTRLQAWYSRMGYKRVRSANFADVHPEFVADLNSPCDFVVYEKQLSDE